MANVADLLDVVPRLRLCVVATGAGAGIQNTLWSIPGISSILVGASFPYAKEQVAEYIGYEPSHYCSENIAYELAMSAFIKACKSSNPTDDPIGLGITASVASNRPHRGSHRAYIAVIQNNKVNSIAVLFNHTELFGQNLRLFQGEYINNLCIDFLISSIKSIENYSNFDKLRSIFFEQPVFRSTGLRQKPIFTNQEKIIFLPGTFNPIHDAHREMANTVASTVTGSRVIYSVTASPLHKPKLNITELLKLVAHIRCEKWRHDSYTYDVLFSDGEPLYIDKARRYPGAGFIIGADALLRMLDLSWGTDIKQMLNEFKQLGTKFYVFGRNVQDHGFVAARAAIDKAAVMMSDKLNMKDIFIPMEGSWGISSSEIRDVKESKVEC